MRRFAILLLLLAGISAADVDESIRLGREAMRARNYDGAIEHFQQATRDDATHVDAWFRLGLAFAAAEQPQQALQAYEKTVELDPTHAKALNNIANAHFRRGDYEVALGWYERALEIEPNYLLAHFHRGWVLRHFARHDEAEDNFRQCMQLTAANDRERATQFDCLFYYGALRFRAGDFEQAAQVMEQVVSLRESHPEARYYLGMAYRRLGRMDAAKRQLEIHRQMLRAARRDDAIEKAKP